jgi:phage-related holin
MQFQIILAIKNIKYQSFSDSEFELSSICVIFFCLIEGFSIFHENLPKCGFNIWEEIKKMIGFYKKVKTEFKEE